MKSYFCTYRMCLLLPRGAETYLWLQNDMPPLIEPWIILIISESCINDIETPDSFKKTSKASYKIKKTPKVIFQYSRVLPGFQYFRFYYLHLEDLHNDIWKKMEKKTNNDIVFPLMVIFKTTITYISRPAQSNMVFRKSIIIWAKQITPT